MRRLDGTERPSTVRNPRHSVVELPLCNWLVAVKQSRSFESENSPNSPCIYNEEQSFRRKVRYVRGGVAERAVGSRIDVGTLSRYTHVKHQKP